MSVQIYKWNVPKNGTETFIGNGWLIHVAAQHVGDGFVQVWTEEEGEPEFTRRVRTIVTGCPYPDTDEGVWNAIGTAIFDEGRSVLHVIKFNPQDTEGYIKGRKKHNHIATMPCRPGCMRYGFNHLEGEIYAR